MGVDATRQGTEKVEENIVEQQRKETVIDRNKDVEHLIKLPLWASAKSS